MEVGPLIPSSGCGQNVEGFDGSDIGALLLRIKHAGGSLRFLAMDEPYFDAALYGGPNACHWSAMQVADLVLDWAHRARAVFPKVAIGDIEPVVATAPVTAYTTWMDAYQASMGDALSFFHLDVDWSQRDWTTPVLALEKAARQRGIPAGIIYNGNGDDISDEAWLQHAAERMAIYEVQFGGHPDQVIFQSWTDRPHYVLPETDPSRFTALINRYFGTRTQLSVTLGPRGGAGAIQINGRLSSVAGTGIGGQHVQLSVRALDGPGRFVEYTLSGSVPAGATMAVAGIRVNTEGAGPGPSESFLYSVSYREGSEATQRVPDGDFGAGLGPWGLAPTTIVQLEPSDRGSGRVLHIAASAAQTFTANSSVFPVTPSVTYTATFGARIPPAGAGSGDFMIIFLGGGSESARSVVAMEITPDTYSADSGEDGSLTWRLVSPTAHLRADAALAGSAQVWPAFATAAQ